MVNEKKTYAVVLYIHTDGDPHAWDMAERLHCEVYDEAVYDMGEDCKPVNLRLLPGWRYGIQEV